MAESALNFWNTVKEEYLLQYDSHKKEAKIEG